MNSYFLHFYGVVVIVVVVVVVVAAAAAAAVVVVARDSIYAKRAYAIAIPSVRPYVRLSVRHTGGSVKNGWS